MYDDLVLPASALMQLWLCMAVVVFFVISNIYRS